MRLLGSIPGDAADCAALIRALGARPAHVVGVSYSAAVAPQLASKHPEAVSSLALLEPPPLHTPSGPEFRAANNRLAEARRERGAAAALEEFLTLVVGPGWRNFTEGHLPGSTTQMEKDAATFFDSDMPALLDWEFGPVAAGAIACPVIHIGGGARGQWFAEVRRLVLEWLPHAEDAIITGADHSPALTHAPEVAAVLADFLAWHPTSDGNTVFTR